MLLSSASRMLSRGISCGAAPRILIVDDDPNLLVLLADQLRADGYEIATARDGDEALRRLRTSWPDLLIIDMMMPRMDGLEATRAIRALPGPESKLPIIGLTAAAMPEDEAACLAAGMDGYEKKPIGTERLRAAIMAAAAMREHIRA